MFLSIKFTTLTKCDVVVRKTFFMHRFYYARALKIKGHQMVKWNVNTKHEEYLHKQILFGDVKTFHKFYFVADIPLKRSSKSPSPVRSHGKSLKRNHID